MWRVFFFSNTQERRAKQALEVWPYAAEACCIGDDTAPAGSKLQLRAIWRQATSNLFVSRRQTTDEAQQASTSSLVSSRLALELSPRTFHDRIFDLIHERQRPRSGDAPRRRSQRIRSFLGGVMGTPPLHSLNFGTIILLPKCNDAKQIQQYKPIYLLNVSFKIFTKLATNRIVKVA